MRTVENTNETAPMSTPIHKTFTQSCIEDFLRQGWFLGLDGDRIFVGWGDLQWSSQAAAGALYAPDFYLLSSAPWLSSQYWDIVGRAQLHEWLKAEPQVAAEDWTWREPFLEEFSEPFYFLLNEMKTGRLQKAVPVVRALAQRRLQGGDRCGLLSRLLGAPAVLRVYGFWTEEEGLLGATPECLLLIGPQAESLSQEFMPGSRPDLNGRRLRTMALAGTWPTSSDPAVRDEFLHDPKERHEHQLVIQDLKAQLSRWGRVRVGETQLKVLPRVMHLYTPLEVELSADLGGNRDWRELIEDLHPTPALGYAPRSFSLDWMRSWDRSTRGRYGAPFAVEIPDTGEVECWVAIRNIQWQKKDADSSEISLFTGCGLVPASRLDKEWAELLIKRQSVRSLLGV